MLGYGERHLICLDTIALLTEANSGFRLPMEDHDLDAQCFLQKLLHRQVCDNSYAGTHRARGLKNLLFTRLFVAVFGAVFLAEDSSKVAVQLDASGEGDQNVVDPSSIAGSKELDDVNRGGVRAKGCTKHADVINHKLRPWARKRGEDRPTIGPDGKLEVDFDGIVYV